MAKGLSTPMRSKSSLDWMEKGGRRAPRRVGRRVVVGSRGSPLAREQARLVVEKLAPLHPEVDFVFKWVTTAGDLHRQLSPAEMGRGVFVKELEAALRDGEIDLAVHSLKDLPTQIPPGLTMAAIPLREEARDAPVAPLAL